MSPSDVSLECPPFPKTKFRNTHALCLENLLSARHSCTFPIPSLFFSLTCGFDSSFFMSFFCGDSVWKTKFRELARGAFRFKSDIAASFCSTSRGWFSRDPFFLYATIKHNNFTFSSLYQTFHSQEMDQNMKCKCFYITVI